MMSPPLEVKCKPYPEDTGTTRALPAFPSFSTHKTSNLLTSPNQECFPITQEEAKKKEEYLEFSFKNSFITYTSVILSSCTPFPL